MRRWIERLIGAALLVGCGAPVDGATTRAYARLRVPVEQCRAPGPSTVTPRQMQRDWERLEHVLRRGYAGFDSTPRAAWDRVFAEGRAAIGDEPLSALAWRDWLVDRLAFADDNHLAFWIYDDDGERRWRATSAHWFAHASDASFTRDGDRFVDARGRELVSCEGRDAAALMLPVWRDGSVTWSVIVRSTDDLQRIDCVLRDADGEADEILALHRFERVDDPGPSFEQRDGPIPWLRVRSLAMGASGRLERFVQSARQLRDAPVIVLDLRGNGGGSDRFLLRWFGDLTSQDLRYFDTRILSSEVELQGALTFWRCALAASSADGDGRAWIRRRVAQAERLLETRARERGVFRDVRRGRYVERGRAPTRFEGRLFLIVDRGCGSACETAVMLARQIEGATILGENTEGTMKVGELRTYRLPGTGTWVSAGRRVHIDPSLDGFPEGDGYTPDVWLDGGDAEQAVRALLECPAGDVTCAER